MLEAVIKAITPRIMTWSQYAEAAWFMYQKKVMKNPAYKRYMPDYTKCMEHFALHAGERAYILYCVQRWIVPDSCVCVLGPTQQGCWRCLQEVAQSIAYGLPAVIHWCWGACLRILMNICLSCRWLCCAEGHPEGHEPAR
jgi:hypothetical protein